MASLLVLFTIQANGAILCYRCSANSANSTCVTRPRSFPWFQCDGYCQVWHLYSEADSSIYMFERTCSNYCHSGCTQLADMEHRFVGRYSVCIFGKDYQGQCKKLNGACTMTAISAGLCDSLKQIQGAHTVVTQISVTV